MYPVPVDFCVQFGYKKIGVGDRVISLASLLNLTSAPQKNYLVTARAPARYTFRTAEKAALTMGIVSFCYHGLIILHGNFGQ